MYRTIKAKNHISAATATIPSEDRNKEADEAAKKAPERSRKARDARSTISDQFRQLIASEPEPYHEGEGAQQPEAPVQENTDQEGDQPEASDFTNAGGHHRTAQQICRPRYKNFHLKDLDRCPLHLVGDCDVSL